MDYQLTQFVESMDTLSNIRGMDVTNPVVMELDQPLTAEAFTIVAAINEPSHMGIPINTSWTVFNPSNIYNRKVLKLKSTSAPETSNIPGAIVDAGFTQTWIELATYHQIFEDGQYYSVTGGTPGPVGPQGPQGDAGPVGPAPTVDYNYIVAQVLAAITTKTLTGIAIVGASSLNGGTSTSYSVTATFSDGTTMANASSVVWTADSQIGTISSLGVLAASTVSQSTAGQVHASLTYHGVTMTANKDVMVNVVVQPIYPFYGVAPVTAVKDGELVLGLANRGTSASVTELFTLDSGGPSSNLTMFFAYPQSYGLARFEDQSALGFYGGWDAATGDPISGATGPLSLNVTINGVSVPFYLYETDFPGLGQVTWQASPKI